MSSTAKSTSATSSMAYGVFMWQLMKARHAIKTLSDEAFDAKDLDPLTITPDETDLNKALLGMLVATGRSTKNEIARSIRNGCAGAALQIAWTLFDAYLETLGVEAGTRGGVRVGHAFTGGEQFSRVLWAARNAFAHGFEWSSTGGPKSKAGRISVDILRAVGFPNPSNADVFEYFMLLSDGDVEKFIRRLQDAAKEAAESYSPPTSPFADQSSVIVNLVVLGLIVLAYFAVTAENREVEGVVAFQIGTGPQAITVPIATGKLGSPIKLRAMIEEKAIEALSREAGAPFREVAARSSAWSAQAEALSKTDVGSDRFYRDLLDLCERMEELYSLTVSLPNPLTLLFEEKGCKSPEDVHAVFSSLLETTGEFTAAEFRVVNNDVLALNKPR